MDIVLLLFVIQGLVLSIMLFTRKHYTLQNHLLGAMVITIVFYILLELLEINFPFFTKGIWIFPFVILKLTVPLIFYLYSKVVISQDSKIDKRLFILPIATGMSFGIYCWGYHGPYSFNIFRESSASYLFTAINVVFWAVLLYTIVKSLKEVKSLSKTNRNYVNWIKALLVFFILSIVIEIVDDLMEYFQIPFSVDVFSFVDIVLLALLYFVSYKSLSNPQMFNKFPVLQEKKSVAKYSTSGLSSQKLEQIFIDMSEYVENEKPFLKGDLTIQELADSLNCSRQYLSQVLSEKMGCNFNDYINRLRIEEYKRRVQDLRYKDYTILALAYDSGFNSKTTFNTIFKKHTGLTPSQYRKQNAS